MIGLPAGIGLARPAAGAVAADNAFDPANKSSRATLLTSNRQMANNTSGSGAYANARSLLPVTGLCYLSAQILNTASGEVLAFGVTDESVAWSNASNYAGNTTASVAVWAPNGNVYFGGSVVGTALSGAGDAQIAVRGRRVWVRRDSSPWVGGGDPATDTSPTCVLTGTGRIFAVATIDQVVASTIRTTLAHNAAATTGAPPAGFTPANWGT